MKSNVVLLFLLIWFNQSLASGYSLEILRYDGEYVCLEFNNSNILRNVYGYYIDEIEIHCEDNIRISNSERDELDNLFRSFTEEVVKETPTLDYTLFRIKSSENKVLFETYRLRKNPKLLGLLDYLKQIGVVFYLDCSDSPEQLDK